MNEKDKVILAHLRSNSRIQLTKLSKKTGIPVSTLFEKINGFKKEVITKETIILDFNKLNLNTRAFFLIKTNKEKLKVINFLKKREELNNLWKISNEYDFLADMLFRNIYELDTFKDKLESEYQIENIEIIYAVQEIIREAYLSNPMNIKTIKIRENY